MKQAGYIFFFLWISYSYGQQYNFAHYTIDDGLAQSFVNDLYEDSRGYLWIATNGGISRFDGVSFENYTMENGLRNNQVRCITEDRNGNMWFGMKEGYISKFNGIHFVNYDKNDGLTAKTVSAIVQDNHSVIWVGTENGGIYKNQEGTFHKVELVKKDTVQITVTSLLYSPEGCLYAGTNSKGVFVIHLDKYYSDKKKRKEYIVSQYTTENGLCSNSIHSIYYDSEGSVWFCSNYGVSKYNGFRFFNYNHTNGICSDNITAILNAGSVNFWFGTAGNGVCKFNGYDFIPININNGLMNNYINCILQDHSGNIWFGSSGSGISRLGPECFRHLTEKDGLPGNIITAIINDKNHNLWFGTYGNGACRMNTNSYTYFTEEQGLCSNLITLLFEDHKGNIWFGSKGKGVTLYNGRSFKNLSSGSGLCSDMINSVIEDSLNNIWIGTDRGISIFDGIRFTNFSKKDGLSSDFIHVLFRDKQGNIWIGTDNAGIDMIPSWYSSVEIIKTRQFTRENKININYSFGLSCLQVQSITQDKYDNIWIGTFGGGIFMFNGKELKNYTVKQGLNSNNINLLIADSAGYLWAGTDKGINKIDYMGVIGKPIIKCYGRSEGFTGTETNPNAVTIDSKGLLWFGTIKGATQYNPEIDRINNSKPTIQITGIRLFFEQEDWLSYAKKFSTWKNLPINPVLPYNKNHLTFEFTGILFHASEDMKYQYMLEGFDKQWSSPISKTEVTYSYIPSGRYTFKVRACNSFGVYNEQPASFHFTIRPPFWKSWWFYSLFIISLAFLIYMIFRFRLRALEKEKLILEEKVKTRTIELEREKQVVEMQSEELRTQAEHLEEINTQLKTAKEKSDTLLLNILPEEIAEELKTQGFTKPRKFEQVTVLFADFKNFTLISEQISPEILVNELHSYFVKFDKIIENHKMEKIKTIGDAYMCAGGIPKKNSTHPFNAVLAALEIQYYMNNMENENKTTSPWKLRIGIHTGEVIAGVVGQKKFVYDIWGDTVNISSRLESTSEPGKVNISNATYQIVKDYFICEYRGKVNAKNKGDIDMFFINRIKPEYSKDKNGLLPNDLLIKLV